MALLERIINIEIETDTGTDAQGHFVITGHRCAVQVKRAGALSLPECSISIWGLSEDLMNRLRILQIEWGRIRNNIVTVMAGDKVRGLQNVFSGTIQTASPRMNTQPETLFMIQAVSGYDAQVKFAESYSQKGSVDIDHVLANIAAANGFEFRNYGVSKIVRNPHCKGNAIDQIRELSQAYDFRGEFNDGVLEVWPKNGSRGGEIPLISADTGMIGFPEDTWNGIVFQCLFNPRIVPGCIVQVESTLKTATGLWQPFSVNHLLASQLPNAPWLTSAECNIGGGGDAPLDTAS